MKKQILIALALCLGTFLFAQKKELKTIEKAVKSKKYDLAKVLLKKIESLTPSMNKDMKSKYHYLNGVILFEDGKNKLKKERKAVQSLKKVRGEYQKAANKLKREILAGFLTKGQKAYQNKEYSTASYYFKEAYNFSKKDTVYLYNAAIAAINMKKQERVLGLYKKLKNIKYTGIQKEFFATNKKTGKEEVFDKTTRNIYIKAGSHIKAGERLTESKRPEILKNIALIHSSKGNHKEALSAIKEARAESPEDVSLIVNEADTYLELGDKDNFKKLIREVLIKYPNNPVLHYNVGVVNMNQGQIDLAKTSFEKALELNPSFSNAALNLSNLFIEKGNILIKRMGKLGNSRADNAKYATLKAEKNVLFQKGADVLINFMSKNPKVNSDILYQLKNIYNALGETNKVKEVTAKIEAISTAK